MDTQKPWAHHDFSQVTNQSTNSHVSNTQALGCFHRCYAMGIEIVKDRVTLLALQIDRR